MSEIAELSVDVIAHDKVSNVLAQIEARLIKTDAAAQRAGKGMGTSVGGGAKTAADGTLTLAQAQARLLTTTGDNQAAYTSLSSALQKSSGSQLQNVRASTQLAQIQNKLSGESKSLTSLFGQMSAQLDSQGGAFRQFGQSAAGSLTAMVGPAALATAAIGGLIAVGKSFGDAFAFKAQLDATRLAVNAQISGIRESGQVWSEAAAFANQYKLTQQETTEAVAASIGVMRASKAPIEDILSVLARMQVLSPEQSLQEAAIALKSLASGDTTSLVTRFEVGRDAANEMKQAIQGGADAVQVMSQFLGASGIGMDVLATKTQGAAGAMKDLAIAQEELALAQAQFAQGPGLQLLQERVKLTSAVTRILSGDFAAMGQSITATLAAQDARSDALIAGKSAAEADAAAEAAYAASLQQAVAATQQATTAAGASIGPMAAAAAGQLALGQAAQAATTAQTALTTELQANAQAAVLASAQQAAQSQATANLTATTNAAVTAFLNLNPNIDAAGIAAQVAAGKIPSLIGQLAGLRIAAYSARDAVAALAAQQAINTKVLATPGIAAPGRTSGANNDIKAVLALQKAQQDAADARSDQLLALGSDQQKLTELQRIYNDTVKQSGADSAAAIHAETKLKAERANQVKQSTKAAKAGGAAKLSDQQKLDNSLLASQEQFAQKSEQAEADHLDRILQINQDFNEKIRKAQDDFAQSQLEGRAGFYDSLGSIEDAGLRQSLSEQYEAAFQEADAIAREKGADVGQKFLEARQAAIEAQGQRASEIAQATKEGDKDKAAYLAGVDKLYREAEERKINAIKAGEGSVAAERDAALAEEGAKYADAQAKIGDSADAAAQRKILAAERAGQAIDMEGAKLDTLAQKYDAVGLASTRAGLAPTTAPAAPGGAPPSAGGAGAAAAPSDVVTALGAAQAAIVAALQSVISAERETTGAVRNLGSRFQA